MPPDGQSRDKELERKRLLEEIRKRAEEAELQRIEQEEKAADLSRKGKPSVPPDQLPPPHPSEQPVLSPREKRLAELKERLGLALDRGKVEKASDILREYESLEPSPDDLAAFRQRLEVIEREQEAAKPKKKGTDREEAAKLRAQREAQKKKIADLFEKTNSLYQQEKYAKATETVQQLIAIDPENEDALRLKEEIEKAQQLAEQIRAEEEKRRAEEAATMPPTPPAPPVEKDIGDPWGAPIVQGDVGYDIPNIAGEEAKEEAPPKPSVGERLEHIAERASRIQVPTKAIVTTLSLIVVAVVAYLIIDRIQNAVFPPKFKLFVLPCVAADSTVEYAADGLTEEFINELAGISELRVLNATTSFAFKGQLARGMIFAKSVGANFVLDWNISRSGNELTLSLRLLDTVASKPVWSANVQSSMRELARVRNELCKTIVDTMGVPLTPQQISALRRPTVESAEAYDRYLLGRYLFRNTARFGWRAPIEAFDRAIAADSTFEDAFVASGWAHMMAYDSEADLSRARYTAAAFALRRALALGSKTGETYRLWGMVELYQGGYDKALAHLERAVEFAPNDAESGRRLSIVYLMKGRTDEALKAAERGVADDPRNIQLHTHLGLVHLFRASMVSPNQDEYKLALKSFENGLMLAPDRSQYSSEFYSDALVYLQQHERVEEMLRTRVAETRKNYVDYYKLARVYQIAGRPKQHWEAQLIKAKELLQERLAIAPNDGMALGHFALVQTRLGAFKEAVAAINKAVQNTPDDIDVLYLAARMYALQREQDRALESLKKAVDRRYRLTSLLDMDFFNLRSDPAFLKTITR
jgi:tetratricopeptide (TPR) repeat protein/TolB-like protein